MTITYVATGTAGSTDGTSTTPGLPAGLASGDVMILQVLARGTGSTISTPAGYSPLPGSSNDNATASHRQALFYKVAGGAEVAPTVSQSVSALIHTAISAFRGCDQTTPIDIDCVSDTKTAQTTFTAPSVTPASANAMVIQTWSCPDDNTLNANTQGTLRYSLDTVTGNDGCIALVSILETTAVPSGTTTITQSVNGPDNWVVFGFALRPAAVAAADPSLVLPALGIKMAVEMAFGATVLAPSPTWTDVTMDVRHTSGITINRGRDSEFSSTQPGTCSFTLGNPGRKYDPDYSAGPYFGKLLPMVRVRIRVRLGSTNYTIYSGYVQSWEQVYDPSNNDATCVVSCVDLFAILANRDLPKSLLAVEVVAQLPYAYYPLDDDGFVAADLSGNNHSLGYGYPTPLTPIPTFLPGLIGTTCRHVGTTHITGALPLIWGADYDVEVCNTLEFWFDATDMTSGFNGFSPTSLWEVTATARSNRIKIAGQNTLPDIELRSFLELDFTIGDATTDLATISYAPLHEDHVYHVVAVLDATFSTFTVYVNGQVKGTADVTAGTFDSGSRTTSLFAGITTGPADISFAHIAAYPFELTSSPVAQHLATGRSGGRFQTAGSRLTDIADFLGLIDAGLYSGTNIGSNTYLARGADLSGNALSAMQKIIDGEQGRLFVSAAGVLTAQGRCADMGELSTNAISQATLTDSGSLIYSDLQSSPQTVDLLRNTIDITFNNGSTTTVTDTTSRAQYGPRSESLDTSLDGTSEAQNLGRSRTRRFASPSTRIQTLAFKPTNSGDARWTLLLAAELGYRYTVQRTPQGIGSAISKSVSLEGIQHQFKSDEWTTTFYLAPAQDANTAHPWWTLADATLGKIGTSFGNAMPY